MLFDVQDPFVHFLLFLPFSSLFPVFLKNQNLLLPLFSVQIANRSTSLLQLEQVFANFSQNYILFLLLKVFRSSSLLLQVKKLVLRMGCHLGRVRRFVWRLG